MNLSLSFPEIAERVAERLPRPVLSLLIEASNWRTEVDRQAAKEARRAFAKAVSRIVDQYNRTTNREMTVWDLLNYIVDEKTPEPRRPIRDDFPSISAEAAIFGLTVEALSPQGDAYSVADWKDRDESEIGEVTEFEPETYGPFYEPRAYDPRFQLTGYHDMNQDFQEKFTPRTHGERILLRRRNWPPEDQDFWKQFTTGKRGPRFLCWKSSLPRKY